MSSIRFAVNSSVASSATTPAFSAGTGATSLSSLLTRAYTQSLQLDPQLEHRAVFDSRSIGDPHGLRPLSSVFAVAGRSSSRKRNSGPCVRVIPSYRVAIAATLAGWLENKVDTSEKSGRTRPQWDESFSRFSQVFWRRFRQAALL